MSLLKRDRETIGDFDIISDGKGMMAQAPDGVLLGGNNRALFDETMKKSDGANEAFQGVGGSFAMVVIAQEDALKALKALLTKPGSPFATLSGRLAGNATLTLDLKAEKLSLRVVTKNADTASKFVSKGETLVRQIGAGGVGAGELLVLATIKTAKFEVDGNDFVVTFTLPVGPLAVFAAKGIRAKLQLGVTP